MKTSLRLLTILLLLNITVSIKAQESNKLTKKEAKTLLESAESDYEDKNYLNALDKYIQLNEYKPEDLYYKLMTGICYTYDPDQKHKSIEIIEQVKLTNPKYNLVNFYLGKAYAVNYQFDTAITLFNSFLEEVRYDDDEQEGLAIRMIDNCENAKRILADTIEENIIKNVTTPVNTQYSEYVPVISADESVLIYTYRGIRSVGADKIPASMGSEAYSEDVFVSYKENGVWTEPESIGININTENHDAAIALSVDGQTLFIYKYEENNGGDIYMSRLMGKEWTKPQKLQGDVNKNGSWEGSCSLAANDKILYFASDRKGGLGGRDIYKAELLEDNTWGNVQNLGPKINSIYNDDAPFIHPDNTLYYSSEGHTSIGGYDIFSSKIDSTGEFGIPLNMGYPINTVDDNRYFVLAANGKTGYYSGGGEASIGEQDIFKITPGKIKKPVLALLIGNVYFNNLPTGSTMNLYKQTKGDLEGTFKSNSKTGKYIMALTPGTYKIEASLPTGEYTEDSIVLNNIDKYVELYKDFRIYSDSSRIKDLAPVDLPYLNKEDSLIADQRSKSLEELLQEELLKEKTIDTLIIDSINTKIADSINAMFADNIDADINLKPLDEGRNFVLNNIQYDFDKSTLRPESRKELDRLAVVLKENKNINVEISSHTDGARNVEMAKRIFKWKKIPYTKEAHDKMSKSYNQRLSQRRAQAVVSYLRRKGIPKSRLVAKGYGEEQPAATNDTAEGRQTNRRTEFKVLSTNNAK